MVYFDVVVNVDGGFSDTIRIEAATIEEALNQIDQLLTGSPTQQITRVNKDGSIWHE